MNKQKKQVSKKDIKTPKKDAKPTETKKSPQPSKRSDDSQKETKTKVTKQSNEPSKQSSTVTSKREKQPLTVKKTKTVEDEPVMLCFFSMGFVDLVGIASNYVQKDLGLTHSEAGIMPSLVFFWFLIFSVPTGMLMNKIGRKKIVLLSILVTVASLIIPLFGNSYAVMLVAFSLLGIGNALMQTSLNPLVATIVSADSLASTLTFGQFVKAIASFLAPYIAMWGSTAVIPTFGLDWRVLFPIYAIVGTLAVVALGMTNIEEPKSCGKVSTISDCFALLGKPYILLCSTSLQAVTTLPKSTLAKTRNCRISI